MHVENWLSKLSDQITTDTDIRNEGILCSLTLENLKLHTSMISWMVHLLVKGGGVEAPSENWDHEFHILCHEVFAVGHV